MNKILKLYINTTVFKEKAMWHKKEYREVQKSILEEVGFKEYHDEQDTLLNSINKYVESMEAKFDGLIQTDLDDDLETSLICYKNIDSEGKYNIEIEFCIKTIQSNNKFNLPIRIKTVPIDLSMLSCSSFRNESSYELATFDTKESLDAFELDSYFVAESTFKDTEGDSLKNTEDRKFPVDLIVKTTYLEHDKYKIEYFDVNCVLNKIQQLQELLTSKR